MIIKIYNRMISHFPVYHAVLKMGDQLITNRRHLFCQFTKLKLILAKEFNKLTFRSIDNFVIILNLKSWQPYWILDHLKINFVPTAGSTYQY